MSEDGGGVPGSAAIVLSPHHDDAALALGVTLRRLARRREILLVNCFTTSDHAPRSALTSVPEITALRKSEDLEFVRFLGARARAIDLERADATVRLGISPTLTCVPREPAAADVDEVNTLCEIFCSLPPDPPVFVPAAISNHIDHHLVLTAALHAFLPDRIILYEDFALRRLGAEHRVRATGAIVGTTFRPVRLAGPEALGERLAAGRIYDSQHSPETLAAAMSGSLEQAWVGTDRLEAFLLGSVQV